MRHRRLLIAVAGAAALAALAWVGVIKWDGAVHPSTESRSMSHNDDTTRGVLDPGDHAVVEHVGRDEDLITFYEGREAGYSVAGDAGDVIIYRANDDRVVYTKEGKPTILHRVLAWVEYNASVDGYDITELGMYGGDPSFRELGAAFGFPPNSTFMLPDVGTWFPDEGVYAHRPLLVVLDPDVNGRHDGWLTKGDHNGGADQDAHGTLMSFDRPMELVKPEWVLSRVVKVVDKEVVLLQAALSLPIAAVLVVAWRRRGLFQRATATFTSGRRCGGCGGGVDADLGFCTRCGDDA